ncbi:MAG: hypothetical protein FK731_09775 [Asgard group archaeon]|nr:hypothetical protein [Asgard group archaeon]
MHKKIKNNFILFLFFVLIFSLLDLNMKAYSFELNKLDQSIEYSCDMASTNLIDNEPLNIHYSDYNLNLSRIFSEMYIDILPNGKDVSIALHFTYFNSGEDIVQNIIHAIDITTILTDSRISSIVVFDAFGDLEYKWDFLEEVCLIEISLRVPLNPLEFTSFTISYLLEGAVVSNPDITINYILQWTLTFDEDIELFSLIITMPSQFELYNQSALEPIPDYRSADGRRLEWTYYNILADLDKTWIIRFKNYVEINQPISTFKPIYWIAVIGTFLIGTIIGITAMYYYLKFKTDTERQEIVETLLSQPEKEIIKIIKRNDGVITQSKIVD